MRFTWNPTQGMASHPTERTVALHPVSLSPARHPHHKDQKRGGGNRTQDGNPGIPFHGRP